MSQEPEIFSQHILWVLNRSSSSACVQMSMSTAKLELGADLIFTPHEATFGEGIFSHIIQAYLLLLSCHRYSIEERSAELVQCDQDS